MSIVSFSAEKEIIALPQATETIAAEVSFDHHDINCSDEEIYSDSLSIVDNDDHSSFIHDIEPPPFKCYKQKNLSIKIPTSFLLRDSVMGNWVERL